jgi:hypothetical protein
MHAVKERATLEAYTRGVANCLNYKFVFRRLLSVINFFRITRNLYITYIFINVETRD